MDLLLIVRQDNKYDDCGSQIVDDDDDGDDNFISLYLYSITRANPSERGLFNTQRSHRDGVKI